MDTDFATDLRACAEAGFTCVELWLPKVEQFLKQGHSLEKAQSLLQQLGLQAPAACIQRQVLLSTGPLRCQALTQLRRHLALCHALEASILSVFSETAENVSEQTYDIVVSNLGEVCDIAAEQQITIALEFAKNSTVVGSLLTAQHIVRRAARPNLGILFDTFHFYGGISKMEDLQAVDATDLALVHISDVRPKLRELWTIHDRTLPGTGMLPLRDMLSVIRAKGYRGYCSLELFDQELWAEDPFRVARLAHESLSRLLTPVASGE